MEDSKKILIVALVVIAIALFANNISKNLTGAAVSSCNLNYECYFKFGETKIVDNNRVTLENFGALTGTIKIRFGEDVLVIRANDKKIIGNIEVWNKKAEINDNNLRLSTFVIVFSKRTGTLQPEESEFSNFKTNLKIDYIQYTSIPNDPIIVVGDSFKIRVRIVNEGSVDDTNVEVKLIPPSVIKVDSSYTTLYGGTQKYSIDSLVIPIFKAGMTQWVEFNVRALTSSQWVEKLTVSIDGDRSDYRQKEIDISVVGAEGICSDSDGGKNYYVAGQACLGGKCSLDGCHSDGSLSEAYCENNNFKTEIYNCPKGYNCENGACVIINKCIDSDGGRDYFNKGSITSYNYIGEDYCNGNFIVEFYCSDARSIYSSPISISCPNGCKDGACLTCEENKLRLVEDDTAVERCFAGEWRRVEIIG